MMLGMKDAQQCLSNPFVFGANKITNYDTGGIRCTCSFQSPFYARFSFDTESVEAIPQ